MGKTGVQVFMVSLRSTALIIFAFSLLLMVSCGGSSSSVLPDTGSLKLNPSSLTFNHTINELAQPAAQSITVTSTSSSAIDFSATTDVTGTNWLSVQPSNGTAQPSTATTPTTISVTALPSNLGAGTYTGHVMVLGTDGSRATATVTFKVVSTTAAIMDVVVPTALVPPGQANPCDGVANCMVFTAPAGGSDPQAQLFAVKNDNSNSNPPQMQFTLATATTSGSSWMDACIAGTGSSTCQSSGIATASIAVQPHVGSLAAGTYTGTVTVTSNGAVNSPTTVNVKFVVTP